MKKKTSKTFKLQTERETDNHREQGRFNRTACIRHQCRNTTVLSCHRCLTNTGVEKNEQQLNIDSNFDNQVSLSKSKCGYSNNCLHFFKRVVPL
jgi:hypothetical protein